MIEVSPIETMHRIELQELETIRKLQTRLGMELNRIDKLLALVAMQESQVEGREVGLDPVELPKDDPVDAITKNIRLMVMGIWNAGSRLRSLVEENRDIRKHDVPLEVVEEEEDE
jgi:hypothetical protein